MITVNRNSANPILKPNPDNTWESKAVFNCNPVKTNGSYTLIYRALSQKINHQGQEMELSTIGKANSSDGISFNNREQFIQPEKQWELFGLEDPRVTKLRDKYYIFYTAVSAYPANPSVIKVGLAISKDLKTIEEKYLVTPFNAKSMTVFPEKINGKVSGLLAVNTDKPPAKIAFVQFNKIEDIWNHQIWNQWYENVDQHTLTLQRRPQDHVEIGACPIKTSQGWLLIFSYINNYQNTNKRIFTVEAALLDKKNPEKIIGRSKFPLLVPEKKYELEGMIPDIVFPSGALVNNNQLLIYYGAADNHCCLASCSLSDILRELTDD